MTDKEKIELQINLENKICSKWLWLFRKDNEYIKLCNIIDNAIKESEVQK